MDKRLNSLSLKWGGAGLGLQIGGALLRGAMEGIRARVLGIGQHDQSFEPFILVPFLTLVLLGAAFLIVGLTYYARAKGLHPAYGLFGLMGWIGWIALAFMEDRTASTSVIYSKSAALKTITQLLGDLREQPDTRSVGQMPEAKAIILGKLRAATGHDAGPNYDQWAAWWQEVGCYMPVESFPSPHKETAEGSV